MDLRNVDLTKESPRTINYLTFTNIIGSCEIEKHKLHFTMKIKTPVSKKKTKNR